MKSIIESDDHLFTLSELPTSGLQQLQAYIKNPSYSAIRLIKVASALNEEELIQIAKEQLAEKLQMIAGYDEDIFETEIIPLSEEKRKDSQILCVNLLKVIIETNTISPGKKIAMLEFLIAAKNTRDPVKEALTQLLNIFKLQFSSSPSAFDRERLNADVNNFSFTEILNTEKKIIFLNEAYIKKIVRNPAELEVLRFHGNSDIQKLLLTELKAIEKDETFSVHLYYSDDEDIIKTREEIRAEIKKFKEDHLESSLLVCRLIPLAIIKNTEEQNLFMEYLAIFFEEVNDSLLKAQARKLYMKNELEKNVTSPRIFTKCLNDRQILLCPNVTNYQTLESLPKEDSKPLSAEDKIVQSPAIPEKSKFRSLLENPYTTWDQLTTLFKKMKENTTPEHDACGVFLQDNVLEQIIKESNPRISTLYEKTVAWFQEFGTEESKEIANIISISYKSICKVEDKTIAQLEKNKKNNSEKEYIIFPELTPTYQKAVDTFKQLYSKYLNFRSFDIKKLARDLTIESEEKDTKKRFDCMLKLRALVELNISDEFTKEITTLYKKMVQQDECSAPAPVNNEPIDQAMTDEILLPPLNPNDAPAYETIKLLFSKEIENKSAKTIEIKANHIIDEIERNNYKTQSLLTLRMLIEEKNTSINIKKRAGKIYNAISKLDDISIAKEFKNALLTLSFAELNSYLTRKKINNSDSDFLLKEVEPLLNNAFITPGEEILYEKCLKVVNWFKRNGTEQGKEMAKKILAADITRHRHAKKVSQKSNEENEIKTANPTPEKSTVKTKIPAVSKEPFEQARESVLSLLTLENKELHKKIQDVSRQMTYAGAIKYYAKLFFKDCIKEKDEDNKLYLDLGIEFMKAFVGEGYLIEVAETARLHGLNIKDIVEITEEEEKQSLDILKTIYEIAYENNAHIPSKDQLEKLKKITYSEEFWKTIYNAFLSDKGEAFLQSIKKLNIFSHLFPKIDPELKMEKILEKYRVPAINLKEYLLPILENKNDKSRYENARKLLILCKKNINDEISIPATELINNYPPIQTDLPAPTKTVSAKEEIKPEQPKKMAFRPKQNKKDDFDKALFEAEKAAEQQRKETLKEAKTIAMKAEESAANAAKSAKDASKAATVFAKQVETAFYQAKANVSIAGIFKANQETKKAALEAQASVEIATTAAKQAKAAIGVAKIVNTATEVKKAALEAQASVEIATIAAQQAKAAIVVAKIVNIATEAKKAADEAITFAEDASSSVKTALAAVQEAHKLANEVKTTEPSPSLIKPKSVPLPDFKPDDSLFNILKRLRYATKHEVFVGGSTPVHIHKGLPITDWDIRIPSKKSMLNLDNIEKILLGWNEILSVEKYGDATYPIIYAKIRKKDKTIQEMDISLYEQKDDETPQQTMLRKMNEEADYNVSAFCLQTQINNDGNLTGVVELIGSEKDVQDYLDGYINIVNGGEHRVCKNDTRQLFRYSMKNELLQLEEHETLQAVFKKENTPEGYKRKLQTEKHQRQISTFFEKNFLAGDRTIIEAINLMHKNKQFEPFTELSYESIKDTLPQLSIYDNSHPYTKKLVFLIFLSAHKCAQIAKRVDINDKWKEMQKWQLYALIYTTSYVVRAEDFANRIIFNITNRIFIERINDVKNPNFSSIISFIRPDHFEFLEHLKQQEEIRLAQDFSQPYLQPPIVQSFPQPPMVQSFPQPPSVRPHSQPLLPQPFPQTMDWKVAVTNVPKITDDQREILDDQRRIKGRNQLFLQKLPNQLEILEANNGRRVSSRKPGER